MKKYRIYQIWKNDEKHFEGAYSKKDLKKFESLGYNVYKTESFVLRRG